jgi:hypothetical protein
MTKVVEVEGLISPIITSMLLYDAFPVKWCSEITNDLHHFLDNRMAVLQRKVCIPYFVRV